MASDNDFINVFEASALLGVHDQTLRKLARQKKIPAFKVGKDWRFRREALVRWADDQHLADNVGDRSCFVLIIDDDDDVCASLARIVKKIGCRAQKATGGSAGLALVAQETPDIILLDLMMPEMNGPQFLAELRKTHPKLPVVIVTGYPDSDLMQQAMQYAPIMLLSKPVETDLLLRTMQTILADKLPAIHGESL